MRLAGIIEESVVDGPGIRISIFFQGCTHLCKGCHNPETWDFKGGKEWTIDEIEELVKRNPHSMGITLTGGDPLDQPKACLDVLKLIKEKYSKLHTIIYTGYLYEELLENPIYKEILKLTDWLIDGPFILEKRSLGLLYRGSSNQRIIDVQKSLATNTVILIEK